MDRQEAERILAKIKAPGTKKKAADDTWDLDILEDAYYETDDGERIEMSDVREAELVLKGNARRQNYRSEQNYKLQFAVRLLFSLDEDKVLTVDAIKKMPLVEKWLSERGIVGDTFTRIIKKVAPDYAHPKSGPKDPWTNAPTFKIARKK